jgi:T5SS/PEP-CTERM-associated repeat protein
LLAGACNSPAADLTWKTGSDYWQSTIAWTANGMGNGSFPTNRDDAYFTNAATYNVTLTNDVSIQRIYFSNPSNTTARITLDLGAYQLNPACTVTSHTAFVVGDGAASTTIVCLASSTVPGKGLCVTDSADKAWVFVGYDGIGMLFVTNGHVLASKVILGAHRGSRGTLVLSGSNTIWKNTGQFTIGADPGGFGSSLVITNSASMDVVSSFRLGSGVIQGGSSNNTLLLDTGGRLSIHSGPVVIGHRSTRFTPSYNNAATVQGGAVWDNGRKGLIIGNSDGLAAATGNVLTVGTRGAVIDVVRLTVTAGNTLNLAGGLIQAVLTTISGTVRGFGAVSGNVIITSGGLLSPSNSLGQLTFSNSLTLASDATTTVQLGADFNPTVVSRNLELSGTLNITDGGGFTNGTYTLFRYGGVLITNGSPAVLTIGTVPDTNLIYAVDISSNGCVRLTARGQREQRPAQGEKIMER